MTETSQKIEASWDIRHFMQGNRTDEWYAFREMREKDYVICPYMKNKYIDAGLCYDMQMICLGYISPSILPDTRLDCPELKKHCDRCEHAL